VLETSTVEPKVLEAPRFDSEEHGVALEPKVFDAPPKVFAEVLEPKVFEDPGFGANVFVEVLV
jgi:hypothetical protein